MEKPVLVLLAAGMGSRYGGLKQMDSMGGHGQSIIDYSIYDARRAGFETVIFIIKREIEEDFRRRVGDRISTSIRTLYAYQELEYLPAGYAVPVQRRKPWGTNHAVMAARELIHGPFAVINADDYYGPNAFQRIYDYLSAPQAPDSCISWSTRCDGARRPSPAGSAPWVQTAVWKALRSGPAWRRTAATPDFPPTAAKAGPSSPEAPWCP